MVGKILEKLQVDSNISVVQKNYLVGNSDTLRKVLDQ